MDIQAQTKTPLSKSGRYALTMIQVSTSHPVKCHSTNQSLVLEFVLKFGV